MGYATWQREFDAIEARGRAEGLKQGMERGLEQGMEKGRLKGKIEALRQLVTWKFGVDAWRATTAWLGPIPAPLVVDNAMREVVQCDTAASFLRRIRRLGDGDQVSKVRSHQASLIAPLLVALACAETSAPAPRPTTQMRDSAGVTIVHNARPADDSRLPWRVGPEPSITIGAIDGTEHEALFGVSDATKLSDGRIVIANGGTRELRVFDASGTWLTTWGGHGEGPGEFTGLYGVDRWPGDSIIAWYGPRRTISVFDEQGNHGRNFALTHDPATSAMDRFRPHSVTADGAVLAVHHPEAADTVAAQLRDAEGQIQTEFGAHPGREWYIHNPQSDDSWLFAKTFGGEPVWTTWVPTSSSATPHVTS